MFNILLLGLTSFFTDISSEMIYPLVPFFLTLKLGASAELLGLIEGIAESVASLLKVFSGYISDRLKNRKGLTIVGYGSSAVGKLLLVVANAWGIVLGARVVDRLGKGIRTAPRDALIADSSPDGSAARRLVYIVRWTRAAPSSACCWPISFSPAWRKASTYLCSCGQSSPP
jgi:MFS family permease